MPGAVLQPARPEKLRRAERTLRLIQLAEITAHSGCEGTPMDSVESVEAAIRLGADAAEVDVRRGAGSLVLSHDRRGEAEYASRPRLEQVFALVAPRAGMKVNCDIKEADVIPDVLALAARYGLDSGRLVLSGSVHPAYLRENPRVLERARVALNLEQALAELYLEGLPARERTAQTCALVRGTPWPYVREMAGEADAHLERACGMCVELGVWTLNVPYALLTQERMERIRARGVRLSVWTVNDEEWIRSMLACGVASLTTLRVGLALAIRRGMEPGPGTRTEPPPRKEGCRS